MHTFPEISDPEALFLQLIQSPQGLYFKYLGREYFGYICPQRLLAIVPTNLGVSLVHAHIVATNCGTDVWTALKTILHSLRKTEEALRIS